MAEENQVMKESQQGPTGPTVPAVVKEPQQVTTKDPKKVEADKRLAAINRKKREAKKGKEQVQLEKTTSRINQYYGIGAVIALGVIGKVGYYIYQSKKGQVPDRALQPPAPPQQPSSCSQTNMFEMD